MRAPTDLGTGEESPQTANGHRSALARIPRWAWALAAAFVLIVAAVIALAVRSDEPAGVQTGGPAVVTTAAPAPAAPATVAPGPSPPVVVPGPTAAPTSAVPVPAAVVLRPDGLGVARFGDGMDAAYAALTTALGPADDPGTVLTEGCTGRPHRTAHWGDLAVTFDQRPDAGGLMFGGYTYGSGWSATDPVTTAAQPVLTMPGGLGIPGRPVPIDQLLAQARDDFPTATLDQSADGASASIGAGENGHKLNGAVRLVDGGWYVQYLEIARRPLDDC